MERLWRTLLSRSKAVIYSPGTAASSSLMGESLPVLSSRNGFMTYLLL